MKHTKRILKIIMPVIAIACTIIFTPWVLLGAWIAPLPDTIQEQVNDATGYGLDGIIVYVDQAGKEPVSNTAGWKNRENHVPADPHALFKIGSISKLYIAVASAKLVNDQTLSLDKSLADYLPELIGRIENADQITLRMMLQHRSGIPNFTDDPEFPWFNPPSELPDYLEFALDKPADFKPDTRYRYSNSNYHLIGKILDQTLGYSHHQFINEEVLAPLGLTHTFNWLSEVDQGELVSGYFTEYGGDLKELDYISPGGSMVATAQDVGIFLRALNDGSLLSDEEQVIYSSIYVYEHTGLLPGYQSIAGYHKDIDTVVIQFVNTSGGKMWSISNIMYKRIIKILRRKNAHNNDPIAYL
ncbi:MAG: serine hydrolase domain-containing protein [Bacteroidota bacterium]|nr:serine hydrolase domain-containing protein [Bacteroidota bacterium]